METRSCGSCGARKTIDGVWYLVPPSGGGGPASPGPGGSGIDGPVDPPTDSPGFLCESCFLSVGTGNGGEASAVEARWDAARDPPA